MAKKSKKRRPGGGRPQATKRITPKSAPGPATSPAAGAKGSAQPAKAQPPKARSPKAQPAKASGTKDRPTKDRPTKAERIEAARRARRRKSLAIRLGVAGIAGAAGILVVFLVIRGLAGGEKKKEDIRARLTAGSCAYDTKSDRTDPAPRNHVTTPTYMVDPPAGGNHDDQAAEPAVYGEDQLPPDGQIVHALEHGYVVLWQRPDLSPEDKNAVEDVARRYTRDVLVVPRPTLTTSKVAATAWGKRLLCGNVEADALDLFTRTYRNQGPEKVAH